jgi:hypothetical protein
MGIADFIFGKPAKPTSPTKYLPQAQEANENAAQTGIDINSLDRTGPFGSSQFQRDAQGNVTGINNQFMGGLAGGVGNAMGAFQGATCGLPTSIDYSGIDVNSILQGGMENYDRLAQPSIAQGQNRINQELANRGIPINDRIAGDMQGNFDTSNALARGNVFQGLAQAAPGMQKTLIDNLGTQAMSQYGLASGGLGLLGGANSLLPQAQQYTQGVNPVDVAGAYQNYDAAKIAGQQAQNQAMSGLFQAGGTVLGGMFNKKS